MADTVTPHSDQELSEMCPDEVGAFHRAEEFEEASGSRIAFWVYGSEHGEDSLSSWAVGLNRVIDEAWISVYRWSAFKEPSYVSLRTIIEEREQGGDPATNLIDVAEAILKAVSDDPDRLETIEVEHLDLEDNR